MRPNIQAHAPIVGALMELSTERVNGMGMGSIPLSKIWMYLDRFDLPDWWEPILLQADASILSAANKETERGNRDANNKVVAKDTQGLVATDTARKAQGA